MPQTFQVLRCYKCAVFQVHPTKKSNKWNCKLCGEKQSLKRFYGLGTGKECRLHVQKLNGIRGELDSQCSTDNEDLNYVSDSSDPPEQNEIQTNSIAKKSKWIDYLDPNSEQQQQAPSEKMHLDNIEVVLEIPKKHPQKSRNIIERTGKIKEESKTKCLQENYSVPTRVLNNTLRVLSNDAVNSLDSNKTSLDVCASKPTNNKINKLIPPPVVTNSRWAQFVDAQEEAQTCDDVNDTDATKQTHHSVEPVFSFIEDEDLDSVLEL